jgi:2-keto-4-pentenoate hydratase
MTLAQRLFDARRDKRSLPSLRGADPSFDHAKAYEVADAIRMVREQGGERVAGRKIGLTNTATWTAAETGEPIWGYVYDTTLVMASNGRAEVDLQLALAPRIEPEIGFCMREAVDPARTDVASLLRAIDWVAPCFEIIDCHFPDWKFKAADGIADFGVHYALVVGEPLQVAAHGDTLVERLRDCEAELRKDGKVLATGTGANTLGNPLLALAAMVGVLARDSNAKPLAAGEIVTTGTLTPAFDVAAGQEWEMRMSGIRMQGLALRFR